MPLLGTVRGRCETITHLGDEKATEEGSDSIDYLEPAQQLASTSIMGAAGGCERGGGRNGVGKELG